MNLIFRKDEKEYPMLPRIIALFGLLFPNGLYVYWLVSKFDSVSAALHNELAVGFFMVTTAAMLLVANQFRRAPLGKVPVRWFVVLSLVGGLGFSIPLYYWLNNRVKTAPPPPKPGNSGVSNDSMQFFMNSGVFEAY